MAIEVRLLHENEIGLANNFFNTIYKSSRSLENFQWEFINGPKGKAIYVVAVDTAHPGTIRIVGIQCAIPIEFISPDGKVVLTAKSEDTLVDPKYRGQKIFERMYDLLFESCKQAGIRYIWGFTPARKAFERIGFGIPFATSQALLVLKPISAYHHLVSLNPSNKKGDKLKILGLSFMSYLKSFVKRSQQPNITLREVHNSNLVELIRKFYSGQDMYFLHQNSSYLNWRLNENPFDNHYQHLEALSNGQIVGHIVVNTRARVSYIEQALFDNSLSFVLKCEIIKSVVRTLSKRGTPLIRVLCFETSPLLVEQIDLLKQNGFTYLKRGNYFVWKDLFETDSINCNQVFFSRLFTQGNT